MQEIKIVEMRWFSKAASYQELWGAEYVQSEGLDPGVVDSQLPVDPRTLNACEDAEVGGQPGRVWKGEKSREKLNGDTVPGQKPLEQKEFLKHGCQFWCESCEPGKYL